MIVDTNALFGLKTAHLQENSNGFFINSEVEAAYKALQAAAHEAGFDLKPASSYRSFERQLAIWNGKFCGVRPILDIDGKVVDIRPLDDWQICQAIMQYSALPGTSRHHWGTDIDFYDGNALPEGYELQLIESEYDHHGPCAALTHWLMTNAAQYGFFFPYRHYLGGIACEPWHISYFEVANRYLSQLQPQSVAVLLTDTDIEGKSAILSHIDEIFTRFVTNISGL
jgi:LAS superfamily LD-carboxypeptidase LdcB